MSPGSPSEETSTSSAAAEHLGDQPGLGQRELSYRAWRCRQGQAPQAVALAAQLGDLARAVGFRLDLGLDVETEQFAQGAHVLVGVVGAGGAAHPQRRLVQDPRGDRLRHHLDPLAVGLAEALPAVLVLGQDPAHDLVAALAQRGDRRHHLERGEPPLEAVELGLDDPLRPPRLGLAAAGVAFDDLLDVVDVVDG